MKQLQIIASMLLGLLLVASAQAAQRNLAVAASGAQEQKRVALVIGNAAYQGAAPLKNPVNDARAMSGALNRLDFQVIEVTDATQKEMNRAIAEFGQKLNADTAALFFYAGHGLQVKGKNYLVPVDAQIAGEAAVRAETVDVDTVMDQLNVSSLSIVILDACRNNPFERSFRKMGGGLAQMDAPKGSFIAYATAPGKTAADGDGKNGLFTQELLKQINTPGLSLEGVFKRVRANVSRATADAQMPWDSSSMTGDFYFKPGDGTQVASLAPVPAPVGGGVSLDDIRKQQEARAQWDKWQAGTKADFDKIAALNAEPDLQVAAWERFLANYTQDNPFSAEDDQLRAQAQSRKQAAQAQQQQATARLEQQKQEAERQQQQAAQTGGTGPAMVRIPGKNYEMGKYHVTRGEFAKFVSETNHDTGDKCLTYEGGKLEELSGRNWRNPGFAQDDNHPVTCVNWHDAQAYASWLSRKTGRQYRLPIEAEWEYACYGGSQSEYCGGGGNIDSVAWYKDNSGGQTHPVGQKQANGYGLHDMSGNLWQWMENKYDDKNDWRALRGGSWNYRLPQFVHAAIRFNDEPAKRSNHLGFRLARTLP